MTTQPADTIAAIRERVEKATPGPWECHGPSKLSDIFSDGDYEVFPPLGEAGPVTITAGPKNADFIAHAPADMRLLLSRYDEACGIIRGLLGELKRFHNGKPVSLCATCNTVAAAQAFLSGTPTDGTQGGEWQCTWPECDGVIQGGPCVCDPSRKLAKDGQV